MRIEVAACTGQRTQGLTDKSVRWKVRGKGDAFGGKNDNCAVVRMVLAWKNEFNRLAAESQLHPVGIHDVGSSYFGVVLRGCHVAIVIAIMRLKEVRRHAANSRMRHAGPDDFFQF